MYRRLAGVPTFWRIRARAIWGRAGGRQVKLELLQGIDKRFEFGVGEKLGEVGVGADGRGVAIAVADGRGQGVASERFCAEAIDVAWGARGAQTAKQRASGNRMGVRSGFVLRIKSAFFRASSRRAECASARASAACAGALWGSSWASSVRNSRAMFQSRFASGCLPRLKASDCKPLAVRSRHKPLSGVLGAVGEHVACVIKRLIKGFLGFVELAAARECSALFAIDGGKVGAEAQVLAVLAGELRADLLRQIEVRGRGLPIAALAVRDAEPEFGFGRVAECGGVARLGLGPGLAKLGCFLESLAGNGRVPEGKLGGPLFDGDAREDSLIVCLGIESAAWVERDFFLDLPRAVELVACPLGIA